jgi:NTP pyrophosphatase (non-canonical NTP hydrolase)
MTDDEIRIKPLSDWKPETDIKLQKAFGKFVEEVGELLEATENWNLKPQTNSLNISRLEEEIADCEAVIAIIEHISDNLRLVPREHYVNTVQEITTGIKEENVNANLFTASLAFVRQYAGQALCIVGRCQIQGVAGHDPKTKESNLVVLAIKLVSFRAALHCLITDFELDKERINKRRDAKIDTKLPWILGTATNLLPDNIPLNQISHPAGTVVKVKMKRMDALDTSFFAPSIVKIDAWSPNLINQNDVAFHAHPQGAPSPLRWYSSENWIVETVVAIPVVPEKKEPIMNFCINKQSIRALAESFCKTTLPAGVAADPCATNAQYPHSRSGTNLLSVDQAEKMLDTILSDYITNNVVGGLSEDTVVEDISFQEYCVYTYPNRTTFRVDNPVKLYLHDNGSVRILDADGVTHYPIPDWVGVSWKDKDIGA